MAERFDVAVIGAGIVGTATALHLLMRGKSVVMFDRRGAGEETSYGNAGAIEASSVLPYNFPPLGRMLNILLDRDPMARVHYDDLPRLLPWIVDFYFKSRPATRKKNGKLLRPLLQNAVDEHRTLMLGADAAKHLKTHGYCRLYRQESTFQADAFSRDFARECGVPFEVMDSQTFGELEPDLIAGAYQKVVRYTSSATLTDPGAVVKAYAERFVRDGGDFIQDNVRGLAPLADGWRIETLSGAVEAQHAVICTGPWANDILKPLGYRFPLGFKRGYHKHFAAETGKKLGHYISDADIGYALAPMEQGYRLTTGAEFASRDAPPTPVQIDRILPRIRELFPLGEALEAKCWCGSRPCFTDSLPMIDVAPRHRNLWFNFGHGHLGMTLGPSTGRLIAEMIMKDNLFCNPYPYRATRFRC
jgi:D-amino-acid dehydrogenase